MTDKQAQHTPGPWGLSGDRFDAFDDVEVIDEGERTVCEVAAAAGELDDEGFRPLTPEVTLANARLIAAAPEMYEALRDARRTIISAVESGVDIPGFDPTLHVTVKTIDSALAKAEGRQP